MRETFRLCRKCGRPVSVIEWGVYRKILVDAEAVEVVPDSQGEDFVRVDGSKVRGREIRMEEEGQNREMAYRPHAKRCGRQE